MRRRRDSVLGLDPLAVKRAPSPMGKSSPHPLTACSPRAPCAPCAPCDAASPDHYRVSSNDADHYAEADVHFQLPTVWPSCQARPHSALLLLLKAKTCRMALYRTASCSMVLCRMARRRITSLNDPKHRRLCQTRFHRKNRQSCYLNLSQTRGTL